MVKPELFEIDVHTDPNGAVAVFEEGVVPFAVQRTFVVTADSGQLRGDHAHRACSQFLVSISGEILVTLNDGAAITSFILAQFDKGLLIPPMHWATQEYRNDRSILLVVCDQKYAESDYIRDFGEFIELISNPEGINCEQRSSN
jgi:hypothetical protein